MAELASRVEVSDDRVRVVLQTMIERGLVAQDGNGFFLTASGDQARETRP